MMTCVGLYNLFTIVLM